MSISSPSYLFFSTPNKITLNFQQNSQSKKPDPAISLLQLCKKVEELRQVHTFLIKTSLIREKHAFGRLLVSFSSFDDLGTVDYARKLFDSINIPKNSFIYNTMMRAYLKCGNPREAFVVYSHMVCEDYVYPDDFTFTFVFSACSKFNAVSEGKQAHAQMIKLKPPFNFGVHSWNSLMDFYTKIGELGIAIHRLFDRIDEPDVVSWNCLISGYVKSGDLNQAQKVFDEMPQRDVVSWTTLLVGYANAGFLSEASRLFSEMPEPNLVSWTALINCYLQLGYYSKVLDLFEQMQIAEIEMDKITITTLLSACSRLGALDHGQWLHGYLDKHGIKIDAHLSTALIDMYSKCGRIELARKAFREAADKKVFVWNSMLGGLALHSFGEEAIELFDEMIKFGIDPNEITYINILVACDHSGLVEVGLGFFNRLMEDQKVKPTIDHYGCLVNLLGRAGSLYDAFQVIESMPLKADGSLWRALLGACKMHGNIKLGEKVGRILIKMEPLNHMNYVLLSNLYAMFNRWEMVGELRRDMKLKGLMKKPGCSSIEIHIPNIGIRDHILRPFCGW
ncbi:pentatricopeptide repeat-containing protein At4g18840-like isoform X2 [Euphorbia lathyris]|uniref:pentatricopeptide repeat-containing protein At4g18840-like isoform X2 n=1 Tax=Euphorbia lathyris TaxID=212925 RepID=UPI003313C0E5